MTNRVIKDNKIKDSILNKDYGVGNLYVTNTNSKYDYDVICIYDDDSHNVHLFDIKNTNNIMVDIEKQVNDYQGKIAEIIKKAYTEVRIGTGTIKCKELTNNNGYKNITYNDKECETIKLFKYISVKISDRTYNLNFMRFFIDNDNKINCVLACPQFDRTIGKSVNEHGICYPRSDKGQKDLHTMIKLAHDGFGKLTSYCYNPNIVGFEKKDETWEKELATDFIEFIKTNENWIEKMLTHYPSTQKASSAG